MTTPATTAPVDAPCWPGDPDYLDGRVELQVPPSTKLLAYWDADVLDTSGKPPGTIIQVTDPFTVRFRVELVGELWHCLCGSWCFDLKFTSIGDGPDFDLRDKLDPELFWLRGWEGCRTRCIERVIEVPPGTIPAEYCGSIYEVGATVALHCCDRPRPILFGYEALEEIAFY